MTGSPFNKSLVSTLDTVPPVYPFTGVPVKSSSTARISAAVTVTVTDHVLGRRVEIAADLLTLASAVIPNAGEELARKGSSVLNRILGGTDDR